MDDKFLRSRMLLGEGAMEALGKSKVTIFGVGGVGSYAAEGLIRSGVGSFVLVDPDEVAVTNINRQIHAHTGSVGRLKAEVMRERMLLINPEADIRAVTELFLPGKEYIIGTPDLIIDAVDMVTAKIGLILYARERGIPIISSMGMGNKLDPGLIRAGDIYETSVCPLAKVMRRELRRRGVERLRVVYSTETPVKPLCPPEETGRRATPGSVSFVPSAAGLHIAAEAVKILTEKEDLWPKKVK